MPSSAASWMSSMSLSVSAGAEMPPPWRFTPLRLESSPPERTTVVDAACRRPARPAARSGRRQQQGIARMHVPGQFLVGAADLGAVARVGIERGVERERRAFEQVHAPSRKLSMRIFGPARSASTPDVAAAPRAPRARTISTRLRCDSRVPCEKLTRATSSPASTMPAMTLRDLSVAGPSVATILVLRSVSIDHWLWRAASQHRHGRQSLAFDEFEERAAAGGDVGDAVLDAVLLDRRQGIAAAGERKRLAAGDRIGDRLGALAELIEFEHPDRAVPDDGARADLSSMARTVRRCPARCRGSVRRRPTSADRRARRRARWPRIRVATTTSDRQRNLRAARARALQQSARDIQHVLLAQRLADLDAGGRQEGVGDAAADDQLVDLVEQCLEHLSLVDTFEPATMATSGRAGLASARSSASSSATSSGPAQATGANAPPRACWPRPDAPCRTRP